MSEVWIIDDDATFAAIMVRTLQRRGHQALAVSSAAEALALLRRSAPQQVVLDLNLAGQSGLALIRPLLVANPDCRIVVLTGYASIATAVDAIKLGAVQYFAKPVELEAILGALFDDGRSSDIGDAKTKPEAEPPVEPLSVNCLEWEHIQRVLLEHDGNVSATARALKMHRRTLQRKLSKRPVKA